MRIRFLPQRRDDTLVIAKVDDTLTINGEDFDFGPLAEGDTIPAGAVPCAWISGPVERIEGEVRLTVILPIGPNPSPAVAFPEPVTVTGDGPIAIPHDEEPDNVDA